jgi:hypothetical protein
MACDVQDRGFFFCSDQVASAVEFLSPVLGPGLGEFLSTYPIVFELLLLAFFAMAISVILPAKPGRFGSVHPAENERVEVRERVEARE